MRRFLYVKGLRGAAKIPGRIGLLVAALLFSTGGVVIKATALSSWQIAGFRSAIAAVVLAFALPGARRGWTWRTWLVGVAYAATLILFVAATKLTTAANAIFLQSTAPLYLLVLGPFALREPVRRRDLMAMALVLAGFILLMSAADGATATAPNPRLGNLFGAASGLAWALTLAGLRWTAKTARGDAGAATVVAGNLLAFVVCLPFALPVNGAGWGDLATVLHLGVFQVALAYFFLTRSLRSVSGLEASLLLMAEPVFNPVWTWMVHGEKPGLAALGGGVLILAAALAGSWNDGSLAEG